MTYGRHEFLPGATLKVRSPYTPHEERIAREDEAVHVEAHTARRVPGGMEHLQRYVPHRDQVAFFDCDVRRGRRLGAEHVHEVGGLADEIGRFRLMDDDLRPGEILHPFVAHYVIHVRMSVDDVFYSELVFLRFLDDGLTFRRR